MRRMMLLFCCVSISFAQIRIISTTALPVPATERWSSARYTPDGRSIIMTNVAMNGLWEYDLQNKTLRSLTDEPGSGFGFTISPDGQKIGYRTTVSIDEKGIRVQRAVTIDRTTLSRTVVDEASAVDIPFFTPQNRMMLSKDRSSATASAKVPFISANDDAGIHLTMNGTERVLDPFRSGRYIWPVLSPDGQRVAAVHMEKGAFLMSSVGTDVVRLGRCDAPQWTHDGAWIIGMDDRDDGNEIVSSELIAVSADGKTKVQLTNSVKVMEMFPATHPSQDRIIATTPDGTVFEMMYSVKEGGR